MKVKLLLAETGTIHSDGTVSLLRLGITHVWGKTFPIPLQATLVVRVEATMVDAGPHSVEIRGMTADGADFMPKIDGQFVVPQGGGPSNLMLRFSVGFQAHGEYTIAVLVDRTEHDRITISVVAENPAGAKS